MMRFKVGDKVKHISSGDIGVIEGIYDSYYWVNFDYSTCWQSDAQLEKVIEDENEKTS